MPELTSDDRKQGLEFANKLSLLASDAPDVFLEKIVHRTVNQIRQRYGYSTRLKKLELLRLAKEKGGVSIADLVIATGWHRDEIFDMAKELEIEKRVRFDRIAPAGGRGGRPAILIFVIESLGFAPPQVITTR